MPTVDTSSHSHAPTHVDEHYHESEQDHVHHGASHELNNGHKHHTNHYHHQSPEPDETPCLPAYGTINHGLHDTHDMQHETSARVLWERPQQEDSSTPDKLFFATIVFFALLALMSIWLLDAFDSTPAWYLHLMIGLGMFVALMIWILNKENPPRLISPSSEMLV